MRTLVLFLLGLVAVSAYPRSQQRIIGGTLTNIDQHPDLAGLLYTSGIADFRQQCGGIIINNRSILTAAHCTFGNAPASWRVRLGSTFANSGGTVFDAAQIINHPNYHLQTFDWDIGIIRVTSEITQTDVIRIANLGGYFVGDNEVVWAAGWGLIEEGGPLSEQLRHVQMWSIDQAICIQRYGDIITDNMLCAGWLDVGGRDTCQNDSGGPLYHNEVVVGVTSFGSICGSATFPGVYARVSQYISWISQNA